MLCAYILIICSYQQLKMERPKIDGRKSRMVDFLVKQGEIDTSNGNSSYSYINSIYERVIYSKKPLKTIISTFGTLSPHGRQYIALQASTHTIFLKAADLTSDMNTILSFLSKQNLDKQSILNVLQQVTKAYQYNIELHQHMTIQVPPPG
jgi:hypothetical protein